MRTALLAGIATVLLLLPEMGMAQTGAPTEPTPQTAPAPDATPPAPDATPPASNAARRAARRGRASGKRGECRQEARRQGLRGRKAADHAVICLQEARLECLKKAVADGIAGRGRRDYIRNCMGEEERSQRPRKQR